MNFESYISESELQAKPAKKRTLWQWLTTMQFAIWVLVALGALSVLSLFVGELQTPEAMRRPAETQLEAVGRALLTVFQMDNPFRSWWYRGLLTILCVSLLACIIDRAPVIWRFWRKPPPADTDWLKNVRHAVVRTVNTSRETLLQHLGVGWSWRLKTDTVWIAERGRVGMWGPILTHLGLLLLGVGALVGSFGGVSAHVGAFAGETIPHPEISADPAELAKVRDLPFEVRLDSFRIIYYPLQPGQWVLVDNSVVGRLRKQQPDGSWLIEARTRGGEVQTISALPFDIRNSFDGDLDRSNIQEYASYVTVLENGQETGRTKIAVNSPLRKHGYRFYQSSYDPDRPRIMASYEELIVTFTDSARGVQDSMVLKPGVESAVKGDTLRVTAGELLPHFKIGQGFKAYSESAEWVNPAVQLTFRGPAGFEKKTWVFLKFPSMEPGPGRYSYKLAALKGEKVSRELRTIFEIKKTYGGEILWAGFIVGTLGLILCFYVFHRVLYLEWPTDGGKQIRLTGLTRKTVNLYARKLDHIVERSQS